MSEYEPQEREALRKLFCGGLDRDTTDETFRAHFDEFGHIVDLIIIRDKATQVSKGFGFVTFDHSDAVAAALDKRPHVIDGKTVEIKRAIPREENNATAHQRTKKLFFGGLPSNTTAEDLTNYIHDTYAGHGQVEKCDLIIDKDTGKVKGYAFVEVSNEDLTDLIIIKDPKPMVCGKQIEIKKCEDRSSGGGRGGGRGGRGGNRGGGRGRMGRGGGFGDRGGNQQGSYWGGVESQGAGSYGGGMYGGSDYMGGSYGGGGGGMYQNYGGGSYGGGYDQSPGGYQASNTYGTPRGGARGAGAQRYRPY